MRVLGILVAKTIKDTVYRNQLRTEEEMKDATETEIQAIVECTCKKIFVKMFSPWFYQSRDVLYYQLALASI